MRWKVSNQSIIEHRANYYYVEFREDFIILCQNCTYQKPVNPNTKAKPIKSKASAYCKAYILAILESWTNDKRGKGGNYAVFMTYKQWIDSMYGIYGRTVIIDSLDELVGEGLVSREPYIMFGKDTYQYTLNFREINKRIKQLPEREPSDKHPQVNWARPQIDASTSKRVDTGPLVDGKASTSKRGTRPLVDEDPSTSNHNIESTKNLYEASSKHQVNPQLNNKNIEISIPETPIPEERAPAFLSRLIEKYSKEMGESPENMANAVDLGARMYRIFQVSESDFRDCALSAMEYTRTMHGSQIKSREARVCFFGRLKSLLKSSQKNLDSSKPIIVESK
jgi:hypothetical protein